MVQSGPTLIHFVGQLLRLIQFQHRGETAFNALCVQPANAPTAVTEKHGLIVYHRPNLRGADAATGPPDK
jgi:hypothetical protein